MGAGTCGYNNPQEVPVTPASTHRPGRWKFGTTRDVAGLLQFMTKKDYTPFFEQYYWGMETPQIKR